MSSIQLFHGTDHIIEVPDIHIGNPHNDYGRGFYCTRIDEMAREWACKKNTDGFVNNPMVGATVAVAVAVEEAMKK